MVPSFDFTIFHTQAGSAGKHYLFGNGRTVVRRVCCMILAC
jgi:hypothetical protein